MSRTTLLPTHSAPLSRRDWPFTRFGDWPEFGLIGNLARAVGSEAIRIEEFVDGDTLVVRAELPGINPDKDVDVSISGRALHIQVTREDTIAHTNPDGFRTEFHYGTFTRSIGLPTGAYESEVKATYDNGILDIRLPIAKTATRKIEVKHG